VAFFFSAANYRNKQKLPYFCVITKSSDHDIKEIRCQYLQQLGGNYRCKFNLMVVVYNVSKLHSLSLFWAGICKRLDKGIKGTSYKLAPAKGTQSNKPNTTVKKYNSDRKVVKEWNKGHPDHPKNSKNYNDHIHDYKTAGDKESRQPARVPKKNEVLKDFRPNKNNE
jgi:hypothetical protein